MRRPTPKFLARVVLGEIEQEKCQTEVEMQEEQDRWSKEYMDEMAYLESAYDSYMDDVGYLDRMITRCRTKEHSVQADGFDTMVDVSD